ncbi:MAG TPA: hypothetical protein VGU71_17555 [Candidatus Dormibacteraeota bacterium]|nr:hypothetical protein [Candidatus Dormibacteraeota bacterium]
MAAKSLTKEQWEWIAVARILSRQRPTTASAEEVLEGLLGGADQAMVNAFTTGFRAAQARLAIGKLLPEPSAAAAALESAQVVALAILVREQMYPLQFASIYRPYATVLPGPGYEPPPSVDRQIASFLQRLPSLSGEAEAEVAAVAKVLSEPPKPAPAAVAVAPGTAPPMLGPPPLDPAALYSAAWKAAIATANSSGRTNAFRAAQDGAEQNAPHDGSGIVGCAGVAAGGIFLRDVVPIEQVLVLYEPFAAAFPYESLQ